MLDKLLDDTVRIFYNTYIYRSKEVKRYYYTKKKRYLWNVAKKGRFMTKLTKLFDVWHFQIFCEKMQLRVDKTEWFDESKRSRR